MRGLVSNMVNWRSGPSCGEEWWGFGAVGGARVVTLAACGWSAGDYDAAFGYNGTRTAKPDLYGRTGYEYISLEPSVCILTRQKLAYRLPISQIRV